jgi:hypothetical protein
MSEQAISYGGDYRNPTPVGLATWFRSMAADLKKDGVYRCCASTYDHCASHVEALLDSPSQPSIRAKPIAWQQDGNAWSDTDYGFTIEHRSDEPDEAQFVVSWGEMDGAECESLEAAQAYCQEQIDTLVRSWAVVDGTEPASAAADRILTCVYCGHQYPQGTPAAGDQVLTDHIRACVKHPMRTAEATITALRKALEGVIGESDPAKLREMEGVIRALPAPDSDKAVTINAIEILIALATAQEVSGG